MISNFRPEEGEKLALLGYLRNNPEELCTQLLYQILHIYKIYKICSLKH